MVCQNSRYFRRIVGLTANSHRSAPLRQRGRRAGSSWLCSWCPAEVRAASLLQTARSAFVNRPVALRAHSSSPPDPLDPCTQDLWCPDNPRRAGGRRPVGVGPSARPGLWSRSWMNVPDCRVSVSGDVYREVVADAVMCPAQPAPFRCVGSVSCAAAAMKPSASRAMRFSRAHRPTVCCPAATASRTRHSRAQRSDVIRRCPGTQAEDACVPLSGALLLPAADALQPP